MGGSETVKWLNMGLHEPDSIYSAYKWTSRFFDCCINMLIQTDYKIYEHYRNNHLGNERVMSHAELDESIIYATRALFMTSYIITTGDASS